MKNNTKTPLFATLRKALNMAIAANKTETSAAEIIERTEDAVLSRRKFLENTSKIALIGGLIGFDTEGVLGRSFFKKNPPRIAIVGGGMAGLAALHTFKKAGFDATIYEASGRTNGRILTVQKAMGERTWTEFGGEWIDSNHKDMWDLAKEFQLELMDTEQNSEKALTQTAFFFEGKHRSLAEVITAFQGFSNQIKADAERMPKDLSFKTRDPFAQKLDQISISEYLESIGASGWIKNLLEVSYESEYGLSPQVQPAISFVILINPNTDGGQLDLYGSSDERYKIRGGNQSLLDALANKYTAHIELHRSLESISHKTTHYDLTFSGLKNVVKADFVILTVPFTKLRQVDIRLQMPQVKWDCINKLNYGTHTKMMLGMTTHHWRTQGFQGLCYSDTGVTNGWDNAQLQTADNEAAGLSILLGGEAGLSAGRGSVAEQKDFYLQQWEKVYGGTRANFNGKTARMPWAAHPFSLGSYACYTLGQYTTISQAEILPVGNVYFAGEHCGGEFVGFMNGAAKTGREAAEVILAKVSVGK